MKKALCFLLCVLLLFSVAFAESVTEHPYEITIDGETRVGKYTGNLENGLPNGYGIFTTTNPIGYSWHYIGNWQDGLMQGQGAIYWEDGSLEIGEYNAGHFIFGFCNYDGVDLIPYSADISEFVAPESLPVADDPVTEETAEPTAPVVQYIGNMNSHVFHTLNCDSVKSMKEKNKIEFFTREEAIQLGYKPCQRCNP